MKWPRHFVALLFITASAFALAPMSSGAAPSHVVCGQTVTTNTTLTSNLNCSGPGLIVRGEGTVLDLNSFTITGSGTGDGVTVPLGESVTVRNGTIQGFNVGVRGGVQDGFTTTFTTLAGLTIRNNVVGIGLGLRILVKNSIITRNSSIGMDIGAANGDVVTGSLISENGSNGITLLGFADGAVFSHNTFKNNGGDGLAAFDSSSTVVANFAIGNKGDGIRLETDLGPLSAPRYFIARNVANHNGRLGISACSRINPDHECADGMTDGGGNVANFNGDPRQCVNVVCARQ